ncbi:MULTISPECIES: thioredoxin [Lachnospira]|uniref:Thioredoxin n=2 Tax=Lachnospira TaxID=28050 RepID=A0A1H5UC70_9FIRM|nr:MULTISPECIES: thioredoxin [Lachnospira]MCR5515492.1 thioredoxin [Lachnospira sp.]SDM89768.1 thioredoxin [Lachnospira pectinoschiza]SEF72646.1 thioredoxin [Lachnospira multipara]
MQIIHGTESNFEAEVLNSDKPVLVDFWATWCGPCKMLAPVLEKVAASQDDVKIVKIDVDENPAIAEKFNVMSIPTLILFKDGKEVNKQVGFVNEPALKAFMGL